MLLRVIRAWRGIRSVLNGALSEELLKGSWDRNLIVFTRMTPAVGGLSFPGKRLGWVQ
jgi:hypothetical protein